MLVEHSLAATMTEHYRYACTYKYIYNSDCNTLFVVCMCVLTFVPRTIRDYTLTHFYYRNRVNRSSDVFFTISLENVYICALIRFHYHDHIAKCHRAVNMCVNVRCNIISETVNTILKLFIHSHSCKTFYSATQTPFNKYNARLCLIRNVIVTFSFIDFWAVRRLC